MLCIQEGTLADAAGWTLNRYVMPLDQRVPLDGDGFLDVAGTARRNRQESSPCSAADFVAQSPGCMLLAAGGAGKSFVMERLCELESSAIMVDLVTLTAPEVRAALRDAIASGGPVYLDALDDAAGYEPALFGILARELTTAGARGVRWRLACRPAAWDAGLAAALRNAFPGFQEVRLLPLTRSGAWELVADAGVSPSDFLTALVQARLGRLAASPQRLRATAMYWSGKQRELPKSHVEAISSEIDRLLAETDTGRPQPALPADRRRRLAARLGAISVFCGTARFARASGTAPGVAAVSSLPSEPEPDDPSRRVMPADYSEILHTDLFSAAPEASVEFQHQQYAEFLAAEYLVERQITPGQLRGLLKAQGDGLIPAPMVAVASWAAALRPALTEDFIAPNALAFAQAGIELPSPDARAVVVAGLLDAAANAEADPVPGTDLESLAHPGLEEQLSRHLSDGLAHPGQLWWLAMLAAAGRCWELAPALLREALSPRWPDWARRGAVTAVAVLGDVEEHWELKPLLVLDGEEDPDDEVLAAVIAVLYDVEMDTAELLGVLRPRRSLSLRSYYDLLYRLAWNIPPEDLPMALGWAAERLSAVTGDGYGPLLSQLVAQSWAEQEAPGVEAALARLVAALAGAPEGDIWSRRATLPWADADPGRRRNLAAAAAAEIGDGRWHALIDFLLIGPDDLTWLLTQLPGMPARAQEALAACIPGLARHPTAAQADMILAFPAGHPAYQSTRMFRDRVSINSPAARQWQELRERAGKDEELQEARRITRAAALAAALDETRTDPASWWNLAWWLSATNGGHDGDGLFTEDLTGRPGWILLDEHQQEQVIESGITYLATHQPRPQDWAGRLQISSSAALPDWSGVYLLSTLAYLSPERVKALAPETWRRWAPAITGAWSSGQESDRRLRRTLIGMVPADEKQHLLNAALDQLDAMSEFGARIIPPVFKDLCADLAPALAERLATGRYSSHLAAALLDLLITHAPSSTLPLCRDLIESHEQELAATARRGLAELDPAAAVDMLDTASAGPAELAEIMPHLALTALDDDRVAALARIALQCFPYTEDPPPQYVVFRPDRLYQVRRLRDQVLEQLTQHGRVTALDRLALHSEHEADLEAIMWYKHRARRQAADLTIARPDSSALLRLLGRADARLIRCAADLTEVLIAQLQQIQHEITHQGASRDLWNIIGNEAIPASEDDISDWVRRQLSPRLTIATTIDREVQVERKKRGMGTRIDLTVTAPAATHPVTAVRVITEAKLITNDSLMTAMHDQLVSRYLIPAGLRHGIYLVYWVPPSQRRTRRRTHLYKGELLHQLQKQAASTDKEFCITPFLLDITYR